MTAAERILSRLLVEMENGVRMLDGQRMAVALTLEALEQRIRETKKETTRIQAALDELRRGPRA